MNRNEAEEQLKKWDFLFDVRIKRLKNFYVMNCPIASIINKEVELVKEAGEMIRTFSKEHREILKDLPEIHSNQIIKQAFQAEEIEKLENQQEQEWTLLKNDLNMLCQNTWQNVSSPDQIAPIIIDEIIQQLKERGVILI